MITFKIDYHEFKVVRGKELFKVFDMDGGCQFGMNAVAPLVAIGTTFHLHTVIREFKLFNAYAGERRYKYFRFTTNRVFYRTEIFCS